MTDEFAPEATDRTVSKEREADDGEIHYGSGGWHGSWAPQLCEWLQEGQPRPSSAWQSTRSFSYGTAHGDVRARRAVSAAPLKGECGTFTQERAARQNRRPQEQFGKGLGFVSR